MLNKTIVYEIRNTTNYATFIVVLFKILMIITNIVILLLNVRYIFVIKGA